MPLFEKLCLAVIRRGISYYSRYGRHREIADMPSRYSCLAVAAWIGTRYQHKLTWR